MHAINHTTKKAVDIGAAINKVLKGCWCLALAGPIVYKKEIPPLAGFTFIRFYLRCF